MRRLPFQGRALLLVCGFFSVPALASAQSGALAGRVTEQGGGPIAGAHVRATLDAGAAQAFTDVEGRFRMVNLTPGTYRVAVTMLGYAPVETEAVVAAGSVTQLDVQLRPQAFQITGVVVSASRKEEKILEAPATVEVLPEVQIQERPALTPVDHLRALPGVDIITNGLQSTNVVARGFNNVFSGSLHTLTDYRIASIPSLRVNFMHFIPATNEDIQRMEVVLGPGSALYGPNTANGVLHILTQSPLDDQGTTVSLATGVRGQQSAETERECRVLGGQPGRWCAEEWPEGFVDRGALLTSFRTAHLLNPDLGVKLSGQYFTGQEWIYLDPVERTERLARFPSNPDTRIGARDFDLERWSMEGRADWRVLDGGVAVFTAGHSNISNAVELTGIGAGQARDWTSSFYQARFSKDRLFGQVYVNASDAGDTYLLRNANSIIDNSRMYVGQLQHGAVLGDRHSLTYGVDALFTVPDTEATIHGEFEDDDEVTEIGAYLQSETAITGNLDLVLAGRGDLHSHVDHPVFSPRAALVFRPIENQNFRVTYNRAFSTPSTLNLFLDLDAGAAPGLLGSVLGYGVRAQGTGETGYRFFNEQGNLIGVRSPFTPAAGLGTSTGDLVDPTTRNLWQLGVAGLQARGAIDGSTAAFLESLNPSAGALGVDALDLNTLERSPLGPGAVPDVPSIEESTTQTFEVGYKGILGQRILLAADAWYERRSNFTSPLTPVTPLILLDSAGVASFLQGEGMSAAQAEAIANGLSRLPIGVASTPEIHASGPDLMATYLNFGEIDLYGADFNGTVLVGDYWRLGAGASWVSKDFFITEGRLVALNAPDLKGTARVEYRNTETGLNGELRGRYTSEFPVNSAPFAATECIVGEADEDVLTGVTEACVQPYAIFDLTLGYRIPWVAGLTTQLVVQNVLDTPYQSFVGVPSIGRFAMLRLRYEF